MIPKIIMQTWKTSEIPEKWKSSPESIRNYMPDWKYVLMTDEDNRKFVQNHFPDFLPTFDAFPYPIQRADAIRYMWLYIHGGIYIDLDFELTHSLENLFLEESELYFVKSGNVGSIITNSLMASQPGNKFWLQLLECIKVRWGFQFWMIGKHLTVMNTTGPMMVNRVVKASGIKYHQLPNALVMPCSVCQLDSGTCNTSKAYLRPLEGKSWNSWDSTLFNLFLCQWKTLGLILFLLLIILLIWC